MLQESTCCTTATGGRLNHTTRLAPVWSKIPPSYESFLAPSIWEQTQCLSQEQEAQRQQVHGPGTKPSFVGLQWIRIAILTGWNTYSVAEMVFFFFLFACFVFWDVAYLPINIVWNNIKLFMSLCWTWWLCLQDYRKWSVLQYIRTNKY